MLASTFFFALTFTMLEQIIKRKTNEINETAINEEMFVLLWATEL
jgi:hypothetical protein